MSDKLEPLERAKQAWLHGDGKKLPSTLKELTTLAAVDEETARTAIAKCAGMKRRLKGTDLLAHPGKIYEKRKYSLSKTHQRNIDLIEGQMNMVADEIEAWKAMGESAPPKTLNQFMSLKAEWEKLTGVGAFVTAANDVLKANQKEHLQRESGALPDHGLHSPAKTRGKVIDVDPDIFRR